MLINNTQFNDHKYQFFFSFAAYAG